MNLYFIYSFNIYKYIKDEITSAITLVGNMIDILTSFSILDMY